MIPSDKPPKTCPYCLKEVFNLGVHVVNNHPTVLAQIEEKQGISSNVEVSLPIQQQQQAIPVPASPQLTGSASTKQLIRDAIEDMTNIQILKMLQKDVPLEQINKMLNPAPQTQQVDQLAQLERYASIISKIRGPAGPVVQVAESSTDWGALAGQALQVLPQLLNLRKNKTEDENNVEHRADEEGNNGICELIPEKIAGDTGESADSSKESVEFSNKNECDAGIPAENPNIS